MSLSYIPKDQLSSYRNWVLLDKDVQRIGVRPAPSYDNEPTVYWPAGTIIRGKLFCEGWNTEELEGLIQSGNYKQQHLFVILENRSGCIAVIGKLGHRLLLEKNDYEREKRSEDLARNFRDRIAKRRAEDQARHERHSQMFDAFVSHFNSRSSTSSSYSARDAELDDLRRRASQLQQYCNHVHAAYYNPNEYNELQKVNERIRQLQ
jgi:hypothetical protein